MPSPNYPDPLKPQAPMNTPPTLGEIKPVGSVYFSSQSNNANATPSSTQSLATLVEQTQHTQQQVEQTYADQVFASTPVAPIQPQPPQQPSTVTTPTASVSKPKPVSVWPKVWIATAIMSTSFGLYNFLYQGEVNFAVFSEAIAATAGIWIGISLALSGIGYYFDLLDRQVKYRKQFGLMGFYLAFLYSVTLIFRFPEMYGVGLPRHLFTADVILGLGAMSIFTFMALISSTRGTKLMGKWWRPSLRLGYVAYFFLIVRAFIVEGPVWRLWLETLQHVPPPRLLLTIFAICVILLRISLQFSLWKVAKAKQQDS